MYKIACTVYDKNEDTCIAHINLVVRKPVFVVAARLGSNAPAQLHRLAKILKSGMSQGYPLCFAES